MRSSNDTGHFEEIGQKERDGLAEIAKNGARVTSFPEPVLKALQQATEDYLNETARQNVDFEEVLESYRSSR